VTANNVNDDLGERRDIEAPRSARVTLASSRVEWSALAKSIGVSFAAGIGVVLFYALIILGAHRRQWLLSGLGAGGCIAAPGFGVAAMMHK
jgi:hypothetical protein